MTVRSGMKIINSVGDPANFGTLGGLVTSPEYGQVLITCFHCVYHSTQGGWDTEKPSIANRASINFNGPGFMNCGTIVQTKRNHLVDIALIKLDQGYDFDPLIPNGIGHPQRARGFSSTDEGHTPVKKYGAASQTGFGTYNSTRPHIGVNYDNDNDETHYFDFLYKISGSAASHLAVRGDSGALVLDANNEVPGIVVIVDETRYDTYLVPALIIENQLNIKF